ncbi:MAG: hypothetical protein ACPL28_09645 [bacterium]
MLKPEQRMVIMSKLQEDISKSEIARSLGINWRTVQRVEKEGIVTSIPKEKRVSILDPYKNYIIARFDEGAETLLFQYGFGLFPNPLY